MSQAVLVLMDHFELGIDKTDAIIIVDFFLNC